LQTSPESACVAVLGRLEKGSVLSHGKRWSFLRGKRESLAMDAVPLIMFVRESAATG